MAAILNCVDSESYSVVDVQKYYCSVTFNGEKQNIFTF